MLNRGSIGRNLAMMVLLALLPVMAILLYAGIEHRQHEIDDAKEDVQLLAGTMAEVQRDLARSTRNILSTLTLFPAIRALDPQGSNEILRAMLAQYPEYNNFALTALNGDVLAAGRTFAAGANLADRKHIQAAIATKDFAVGEYIISRVGVSSPSLPFAYPVLDNGGRVKGVLSTVIKLDRFADLHDIAALPENSFIGVTDHQGIRLYYYPPREETNPIGKPIRAEVWEEAQKLRESGIFIGSGSDGMSRIVAFERIRLVPEAPPYMYVWAGIPEAHILAVPNAVLARNLLLLFLVTVLALIVSSVIGKKTLVSPIQGLVALTGRFSRGDLDARSELAANRDEIGALTRAFHDMADALKMGQQTLRENEARFRLLMNSLDALVYVADMNTYEVLFINEFGKERFGDVTGKVCWQSLQQGQSGPCGFCTNKYLLDREGNPGESHVWEFQNTVTGRWYYIQDRAIQWLDGRIVRLEIATDITRRKQAEAKLAEETERLAVTLRSIGDGVITADTEGRIILINRVAETLTGWDGAAATGQPLATVFNVVNGVTRQPCESLLEKALVSGDIVGLAKDSVLISKSGQERNIADSGAPIRDKDGRIIGIVLVFRDITEQLRTEQELVKVKKLESIGVLAGGIAHDFNNILTAILGNIDLALLDSSLTQSTHDLLAEAIKASFRAQGLTRQLLTFAKGGEPIKEAASLADVIRDSAGFVLRGDKVACRYLFPDDLWLAHIDKGQMSQVVQNIILNASHAMPEGGIVEVSCENVSSVASRDLALPGPGNYVKMSIRDSGAGIPPNVIDKIFDPYFSTKQQGSGLGLAITHSIVRKHGGLITVQSIPGSGTTFTVYLPAADEMSGTVDKPEDTGKFLGKLRILVMDDEEQVRNIAKAMLGRQGHEVLCAMDGREAIERYREAMTAGTPIDLAIMDLTIPGGMGGREAVREILAMDPRAKAVVASGYSTDPVMANFSEYGFCSAIAKPYQLRELTTVIHQVMTRG